MTIHFAPQPLDPTYGAYRFATYSSWTPPFAGATISGNANIGYTVNLGDLEDGTTANFHIVWRYQTRGVGVDPASFFPDGTVIPATATISSTNQDTVVSNAELTWHIVTPDPQVSITAPVARADVPYTYTLYMSAKCQWERSTAGHGEPALLCAREYEVTQQLPAGAVFQSASHGGDYDLDTHTVTWTQGQQTGRDPAVGWGPLNSLGAPRTVQVVFPASMFTGDCAVDVTTTLSVDMTYLDGQEKSATTDRTHVANNCPPFAAGSLSSKVVGNRNAGTAAAPIVWEGQTGRYYTITIQNRSNVPGVATVVDNDLDRLGLPVYRINTNAGPATFTYELDDGTTDTLTDVTDWTAPAGRRIVAATVVTSPIDGPNIQESSQPNVTSRAVWFYFNVPPEVPFEGFTHTNTASATMSYPGTGLPDQDLGSRSVTVTATPRPATLTTTISKVVSGGGDPVAGTNVTFTNTAATATVRTEGEFEMTPQYVFLAPYQWQITSAQFPSPNTAVTGLPSGPLTVTQIMFDGQLRDAVVVQGASGDWGVNATWPQLVVQATPTLDATPGSTGRAHFFMGDADHQFTPSNATWSYSRHVDAFDLDGDDVTTESFANNYNDTRIGSAFGLTVRKEICQPDGSGGCTWLSNPSIPVGVSPEATDITYRVTVTNGNTMLSEIEVYDVLPHPEDVSLVNGTPRGSTFVESLGGAITDFSSGLSFEYSDSTNPCRFNPAGPADCDPDWTADAAGAVAIKASIASMAANTSVSFTYTAAVEGSPSAGGLACNSVAIDSAGTTPVEPAAVCARIEAADLRITVPDRLPLQEDREGVLPFEVTNLGGTPETAAEVEIGIEAGLTVTSLEPAGWQCAAPEPAPVDGPVVLVCEPVDAGGAPRPLELDEVVPLNIPVIPSVVVDEICVNATVSGPLFDPDEDNNAATACFASLSWRPGVEIVKDDGRNAVSIGDEYDYTLTVSNLLVAETVTGAVVTDTLPDGLEFVSASDGGTAVGQTVTWNLDPLPPAGIPGPDGSEVGSTSSVMELTVRVRVSPDADGDIVNTAEIVAPDPADEQEEFTDSSTDTDGLRLLDIAKSSDARGSGVRVGDVVAYEVEIENIGTAAYDAAVPALIADVLTGVLDDAELVSGSVWISIDGGEPVTLADPAGDELEWSGPLAVGSTAVLGYSVEVIDAAGDKSLLNTAFIADPTSCDDGSDENGLACAILETPFAPTLEKSVTSFSQGDDGLWTIVYGIEVENPSPEDAGYELADSLAFGSGIDVESAEITDSPAAVTPETWSGDGDVALAATVPAGETHSYEVTVVADANVVAGTPSAVCAAGEALGFANLATLTLSDDTALEAQACAEPVEPTLVKELDGPPVKGDDGLWTVRYRVTVTNESETPAGGLAYTLEDELDFPAGPTIESITVTPPAGVDANAGFTGGFAEIGGIAVTVDTALVDGVARIPAADGDGPAVHEYLVELEVSAPEGSVAAELVGCGAPGAGYGNWVGLFAGEHEQGRATACADILLPELRFTKLAELSDGTRPGSRISYTILVTNIGDADFTPGDPAQLVDDMTGLLDDARYGGDASADAGTLVYLAPELAWSGPLPAGAELRIEYTVTLSEGRGGDGAIVNRVQRAGAAEPPTAGVPECAETPVETGETPWCAVFLELDTRALGVTGAMVPLGLVLLALVLGAAGFVALRRSRERGAVV